MIVEVFIWCCCNYPHVIHKNEVRQIGPAGIRIVFCTNNNCCVRVKAGDHWAMVWDDKREETIQKANIVKNSLDCDQDSTSACLPDRQKSFSLILTPYTHLTHGTRDHRFKRLTSMSCGWHPKETVNGCFGRQAQKLDSLSLSLILTHHCVWLRIRHKVIVRGVIVVRVWVCVCLAVCATCFKKRRERREGRRRVGGGGKSVDNRFGSRSESEWRREWEKE